MPYHFRLCKHYVCKVKTRCARFFYPPYLKKNIIFFNLLRLKEPAQFPNRYQFVYLPFHITQSKLRFVCVRFTHTALSLTHSLRLFASLVLTFVARYRYKNFVFVSFNFAQTNLFYCYNTANRKIYFVKKLY